VGVGDICEVPGCAWLQGHSSSVNDCWQAGGKPHTGMVCRHIQAECDASPESSRHGIELSDGARVEHGACDLHSESSGGQNGMRVDRVGVGDLGEVSGGTWSSGHPSSCDDGGRAWREHHSIMVV